MLFERSLEEQEALLKDIARIAFDEPLFDAENYLRLPERLWDESEEC